jgi:acetyl-CoA carboxylase carboxyl transferase subunit alpha
MIGGLGKIEGQSFMIVGQQKDTIQSHVHRNFGMANQKDTKGITIDEMAEKFGIPVLTLIDTPGLSWTQKQKNRDKEKPS